MNIANGIGELRYTSKTGNCHLVDEAFLLELLAVDIRLGSAN